MADRTTSRYDGKVCDLLDRDALWSAVSGPMKSDLSPVRTSDGQRAAWFAEAIATCYAPLRDGSGVQLVVNVLTPYGRQSAIADALKHGEKQIPGVGDEALSSFYVAGNVAHQMTAYAGDRQLSVILFDTSMTAEQSEFHAAAILKTAIQRLPS